MHPSIYNPLVWIRKQKKPSTEEGSFSIFKQFQLLLNRPKLHDFLSPMERQQTHNRQSSSAPFTQIGREKQRERATTLCKQQREQGRDKRRDWISRRTKIQKTGMKHWQQGEKEGSQYSQSSNTEKPVWRKEDKQGEKKQRHHTALLVGHKQTEGKREAVVLRKFLV